MRFARTALGLLLTSTGVVATLAGAAAAFWLVGPDNTISTGSRPLNSQGLAVITAPDLLDRHGPTLHVTASGDKPVFVGIGQDLDVADYLAGSAHTRVIRYDVPSTFSTQEMRGGRAKLTAPGELDWWVAKSGGNGPRSIAWPIQDGKFDVVVMNADGTPAVGADVRFGIEVHRSFGISLLVLGAGIVVLALGLATFRRRSPVAVPTPVSIPMATFVPVRTAPARTVPTAAAYEPVSPFAPDRVSPFAPVATDPPPYQAPADEPITEEIPVVPAAPMLMSPAAVARAKSPAFLVAVGACAPARGTYETDESLYETSYDVS